MPKALVSIVNTDIDEGNVRLIYSVVIVGPPHIRYGSDHPINAAISLEKNVNALKDKIVAYAAEKGIKMSTGDVIIFGAPVVKDEASFTDETGGITSDRLAVAKEAEAVEEPGILTKAWNWLTS